jgi:cytochrome c oxidase subunit 3
MLYTIGLGILFLAGVGYEWAEALEHFPPSTGFGTVFFTLTGVHAFHVLTGLIVLGIVYYMGRDGRFTTGSYWGVEGSVKYWHFVDAAWVLIYPTLYLVS